jgi:hypothetical protein
MAVYLAMTIGSQLFAYAAGLFGLASAFAFVTFRLFDKPLIAWNAAKDTLSQLILRALARIGQKGDVCA